MNECNVVILICFISLFSLVLNGFFIGFQSPNPFAPIGTLSLSKVSLITTLESRFCMYSESKMASSQVEIASSSPFGCVLRDHNRRDQWGRDSNASRLFQKNLKNFVRDHFNSCISGSPNNSDSAPDENSHNPQINNTNNSSVVQEQRNNKVKIDRCSGAREMVSSKASMNQKESSQNRQIDNGDCWVGQEQKNNDNNNNKAKIDHWARAREMVSSRTSPFQGRPVEIPNMVGVSSLVQKWRDFAKQNQSGSLSSNSSPVHPSRTNSESSHAETVCVIDEPARQRDLARQNQSGNLSSNSSPVHPNRINSESRQNQSGNLNSNSSPVHPSSTNSVSSHTETVCVIDEPAKRRDLARQNQSGNLSSNSSPVHPNWTNSESSHTETVCVIDEPARRSESGDSVDETYGTPSAEDSFADWESGGTTPSGRPSSRGRDSDAGEREKPRVADLIKKLSSTTNSPRSSLNSSNDDHDREQPLVNAALPPECTLLDQLEQQRGFLPVTSSPRIRGRQAFNDLLVQMERDRQKEIEGLVECQAVSKFSQKGRIQAMLRLRLLREATVGNHRHLKSLVSDSNRLTQGSNITLLRERFNTGVERDAANLRTPRAEVVNNTGVEHGAANLRNPHREVVNDTLKEENSSTSNRLLGEDIHHKEVNNTERQSTSQAQNFVVNNTGVEHGAANLRNPRAEVANNTLKEENSSTSNQLLGEDIHHKKVNNTERQSTSQVQNFVVNNTGAEHGAANLRNPRAEVANNILKEENSSISNQLLGEDIHHKKVNNIERQSTSQVQNFVVNNTGVEHCAANLRNPRGEVANNTPKEENSSTANQLLDLHHKEVNNTERQSTSQVQNFVLKVENSSTSNQLFGEGIHHKEVNNTERQSTSQVQNFVLKVENSSTSNQLLGEGTHHQEVNNTEKQSTNQVQNFVSYRTEDFHEEANPCLNTSWQGKSYEVSNLDLQESADTVTFSNGSEDNVNWEEQEANNQQLVGTDHDWVRENFQQIDWDKEHQHLVETNCDWINDISRAWNDWGKQEANHQQLVENNCDWISDVSRPRSDWEGLRQARYEEMLDPYSNNEDIRKLLDRKSVSTFLSSNLRDTMDQLMISRVQRQPHPISNQEEEQAEDLHMFCLQRQTYRMGSQQEDEQEEVEEEEVEEEEEEEEEEVESPFGDQYDEVCEYFDQATSSIQSPLQTVTRSYSRDHDHEVSDDSDQLVSPSLPQPPSARSFYHPSIEMELIYDLRGQMEQLHHEIYELRRSIKSCMSMQVKMQRFIKQEVTTAASHSVREGMESINGSPGKGSCRVCYKMQVDSLLYRCGHMCTCFKCAHELQWSSGKCPICQAPIVDVVPVH